MLHGGDVQKHTILVGQKPGIPYQGTASTFAECKRHHTLLLAVFACLACFFRCPIVTPVTGLPKDALDSLNTAP